ncbi:unnamed protein product [Arctia plantaginis]|uniref:Uncharacterized protein n=1 Tax=Arctia plantaginis TaxID=874455 RepID=A0A8S1BCK0_ARCPL|nr:unnamed protein product [Arctia plantaginis]CAB3254642.1 unnamed protein product [Arctia plantaginis]
MFAKILAIAVCFFGLAHAGALYNGVANYAGYGADLYNGYGYAGYAPASYAYSKVLPVTGDYDGYNGAYAGYGGYGYRSYANGLYGGQGYGW